MPTKEFDFRIAASAHHVEDAPGYEELRKCIEVYIPDIYIQTEELNKVAEVYIKDPGLVTELLYKCVEVLITGQLEDAELRKCVENFIYNIETLSTQEARQVAFIESPVTEVSQQAREIVFVKSPAVDFQTEFKVAARTVSYKQTENFQIVYGDIYSQKVGSQPEFKNQVDAFCTILWNGSFNRTTRFGIGYTKNPPDPQAILPIDLSLPKKTNRRPTLSWTAPSHPDADQTIKYDLEVAENFSMRNPIVSITDTSTTFFTFGQDLNYKTYYWRVRAKDYFGGVLVDIGEWTNVHSFSIVQSIVDTVPSQGNITWNHPFLLPPGQAYYFWDTRNLPSQSGGVDVEYRPVVYVYEFDQALQQVVSTDVDIGLPFFVNHFAANPPLFKSAQYDQQTHCVIVRVEINDSLGRLYQLSDFQYLDKAKENPQWVNIEEARIIGPKKDLASDILAYTNRGLLTWQGSFDPDTQFDQDVSYNLRFLSEARHKNNDFYYLLEYLDPTTDIYDVFQTNAADFGSWWGQKFSNADLPTLENVDKWKRYDYRDIKFFAKSNWFRIQVEVNFPDSGLTRTYDTQLNDGSFEYNKESRYPLLVATSDVFTLSYLRKELGYNVFDLTSVLQDAKAKSGYSTIMLQAFPVHVVCEIRNTKGWGEVNWGQAVWSDTTWGSGRFHSEYIDYYNDSNISDVDSNYVKGSTIFLNSLKDFTCFLVTDDVDVGYKMIKMNGITYRDSTELLMRVPDWIGDEIEIRIYFLIETFGFSYYNNPLAPMSIGDNFVNLQAYMGSLIGLNIDSIFPFSSGSVLNYRWRVRGSQFNNGTGFGAWSRWNSAVSIDDSEVSASLDDRTFFTPSNAFGFLYTRPVLKFVVLDNNLNVLDTFLSNVEYDNFTVENNHGGYYWRKMVGRVEDWDKNSRFRFKLSNSYSPYSPLKYSVYELNPDTVPNQEHLLYSSTFSSYAATPAPRNTYCRSDIFKEFAAKSERDILFRWNPLRSESDGHFILDLKREYLAESITIDFYQYPDISLDVNYYDTRTASWRKLFSTPNMKRAMTYTGGGIRLSKLEIKFRSVGMVVMKLPRIMSYRLVPESINTNDLIYVDTEQTDIVMKDWKVVAQMDDGSSVDPNYTPIYDPAFVAPNYQVFRNSLRKTRVSLFRDRDAFEILMVKSGLPELDIVFTNVELFKNGVTNVLLDFKGIVETFYELTYNDVELLEAKIDTDEYWASCRANDGLEWSPWSAFAKRLPANIHTILWSIKGMGLDPTKGLHFRCRATISSPTVDMNLPILGFTAIAGKEIIVLQAEMDAASLVATELIKRKDMYSEMIVNRIDPSTTELNLSW